MSGTIQLPSLLLGDGCCGTNEGSRVTYNHSDREFVVGDKCSCHFTCCSSATSRPEENASTWQVFQRTIEASFKVSLTDALVELKIQPSDFQADLTPEIFNRIVQWAKNRRLDSARERVQQTALIYIHQRTPSGQTLDIQVRTKNGIEQFDPSRVGAYVYRKIHAAEVRKAFESSDETAQADSPPRVEPDVDQIVTSVVGEIQKKNKREISTEELSGIVNQQISRVFPSQSSSSPDGSHSSERRE